jgi:mannitol/fructose-specific phosphotransferase system IIA component (Ntr-type)
MTYDNMQSVAGPGFFEPGSVVWDVASSDKFEAIAEIIHRSGAFKRVQGLDLTEFTNRVIDRELEQSTGFGHGIGVAHGRMACVEHSTIALGISHEGIEYNSIDGRPVHLLFIVANHPDKHVDYLEILSCLATLVRNDAFREQLLGCAHREEAEEKMYTAFNTALRQRQQCGYDAREAM